MEQLKTIIIGTSVTFTALLSIPTNTIHAQTQLKTDVTPEEIKIINTERKLTADKVNIQTETAVIDSIRMLYELDEEDDDLSPADAIYDGVWNNQHVKVYSDVTIPDSFSIDLSNFVMPVTDVKITSPFGPRRRRFHYGTDLKLQSGDTVFAAFDGKVRVKRYERRGYGYFLVIRHPNGLETVYGHLSRFLVDEEDYVIAGQPIALGGNTGRSTGSHLHFECRFLGQAIDPSDIVDFENACTFDDWYVFRKSKVNAISSNNSRYAAFDRNASTDYNTSSDIYTATDKYTTSDRSVVYHRIRNGDTLSEIAKKYRVSVSQICRLNGIQPRSTLRVGKVLRCS